MNPVSITLEGLYQLTVTDANGCSGLTQITITYSGSPEASISAKSILTHCTGTSYVDELCALGNPGYTYLWSTGATSQCINVTSPGSFIVTVTDITTGCSAISNILIVSEDSCNGGGGGSCTPAGSISFTHTSCNPKIFTNTSVNASSFQWNFGNFTGSSATNPTHLYTNAGFYIVTLTGKVIAANGIDSCLVSDTALIEIPLFADFSFTSGCFSDSVCFTDHSVFTAGNNITSWYWDFGDGGNSILQHPCYLYTTPGTYLVSLTISNAYCTTSYTDSVSIMPKPVAFFDTGDTLCLNSPIIFTDLSFNDITYWEWDFGDGGSSLNQNPAHSYNASGSYTVTLVVHDKYGCYDTLTRTIFISPPMASGNITALPDTIVCEGTMVQLIAPACAGCTYNWNTGSINDTITISNTGIYAVSITDTNGCQYSTYIKVIVNQAPLAVINAPAVTICLGGSYNLSVSYNQNWLYNWISNDSTVNGSIYSSVFTIPTSPGIYTYQVIITDTTTGCSDTSLLHLLQVYSPPLAPTVSATGTSTVCAGDTIKLVVSHPDPTVTFHWNTGEVSDTICVTENGCYYVTATDTNGCTSSGNYCVTVNPLPEMCSFFEGCYDSCAPFLIPGPDGGASYQWTFNGNPISGANAQDYLASTAGSYSIIVTNSYGCTDTSGILYLNVYPCPDSLCSRMLIDSIYCDSLTGDYIMLYYVVNLSQITVSEFSLQILPPNLNIAYTPNLVLDSILSGDTSNQQSAVIFNGLEGDTLCFRTHISAWVTSGLEILCCPSDTQCIVLPPCHIDTNCCYFRFIDDSIWCETSSTGHKTYHFDLIVEGCGTLNVSSPNNGNISLNNPYILTGGIDTISGTYSSNNDSVLCFVFFVNDSSGILCADTSICYPLPDCPPPGHPCEWNFDKEICEGDAAVFQYYISMAGTSYSWTFTGGVPGSASGPGPHSITYPLAGTYPVQLQITNQAGITICNDSIKVIPIPSAFISQLGNTFYAQPAGMSYQWYMGTPSTASTLSGETNQYIIPQDKEKYCVVVWNYLGCTDTACIVFVPTGIEDTYFGTSKIEAYPNPGRGIVTIDLGEEHEDIEIELTDITGKQIWQRNILRVSKFEVEVNGPGGLYFMQMRDKDGNHAVIKLIKADH